MSTGRRSARRQAVFVLYQQDLLGLTPNAALTRARRSAEGKRPIEARGGPVDEYTASLVEGVGEHRQEIDDLLGKHLEGWSVQRLGVLERAILRVAAFELVWEPDVPAAVVIDEAVESAKRFCSDEAGSLINGVLGSLSGSVRGQEATA
jgi:N utilization substance protein B